MNHNLIKIVLGAVLLSFGAVAVFAQTCAPAPVGLLSAWSGDGNELDARSRNNGTIQGNVTYGAGHTGQAFQLGGGNGDRVLIGSPSDFQRQDLTIEGWIKRSSSSVVTNSPNPSGAVGLLFAFGQGGYALYLKQDTNKLAFGQVGISEIIAPTLTITDTNWHHVAVTQSGPPFTAGTQAVFYLDGVADTPVGYAPPFSFTTNAAIGSRGDGQTGDTFFGAIDELAIYDRALSLSQIAAIYNAGTAGKCKPLATNAPENQVLWLAGDGDANDLTGNGNSGTLQNGAIFQVGKVGQGFRFDGADDQITVPHDASQNVGANLTIEAWINPSSLPHGGTILQKRTGGNTGGYLLEPTQPSGSGAPNGLQFVIMIGGVYQSLNPANILVPNAWQHVAATYDGAFMRIYVNGIEVANRAQTGAIDAVTAPVVIGRNVVVSQGFPGSIDEVSLYSRALAASEIQSIANAGLAGKYKVRATVPSGIAAWYPGDGNTNELQAANNASLIGGATYATAKVGQGFLFNGASAYAQAPSTPANDPTGAAAGASIEAWVRFNQRPSDAGHQMYVVTKSGVGANEAFDMHVDADNFFKFVWGASYTGFAAFPVQTGVWYHVVATFSPDSASANAGVRFYADGKLLGIGNVFSPRNVSGAPLDIGGSSLFGSSTFFNGIIDEPAIYNRTLTPDEIRNQYFAGPGGKYKGAGNPTANNKTSGGGAEVTFGGITASGDVHVTPIDSSLFPALPMGTNTGLNYDISTTAGYSNPGVCFNASSFTPAQFANLQVFHLESGAWANRTAPANVYPDLCTAGLTSLSPFAIALVAPSAAAVSVSGRVTKGTTGLANIPVTISGGDLTRPLTARTSAFGYYKFEGLSVGETYFLSVSSKQYSFSPPVRVIMLQDESTGADFIADSVPNLGVRMRMKRAVRKHTRGQRRHAWGELTFLGLLTEGL